LEAECHRATLVNARLRDRVAWQAQLVEQLTIDLNHDSIE